MSDEEIAEIERGYRRAKWTLIFHGVFVAVVCVPAVLLRRFFQMPPALLGVVFIVALIVFGGDIMRFLRYRERIRRLAAENES